MRLFFLIPAVVFFFPACHYEDPHEVYVRELREWLLEEMSQVPFDCEGVQSAYYFRALLDGEEVCYSHEVDGYFADLDLWSSFTTETPHAVVSSSGPGEGVKTLVSFGVYPITFAHAQPHIKFFTPPPTDTEAPFV